MRQFGVVLLVISMCWPAQPFAFDILNPGAWFAPSVCPMVAPEVAVFLTPSGVVIDQTADAEAMDLASRSLVGASRIGWTTNGLAIAEIQSRADLVTNQIRLGDGRWCATLHSAAIGLGYLDPIRVMVSKRYAKFSCQYQAILEHEGLHVDIYRQTLTDHMRGFGPRVIERVIAAGPAYGATPEIASAGVEALLNEVVQEVIGGIKAESSRKNAVIDTDQSYFAIQARCPAW